MMAKPLTVKGIFRNQYNTDQYAILTLRIPGTDNSGKAIEAVMTCKIHVVNNLEANLLIGTDVMVPKGMDIILSQKILQIGSCGIQAPIQIHIRSAYQRHRYPIQSKTAVTIPANTIATVPIHFSNLQAPDRDFIFEPCELDQLSLFTHVLNRDVPEILIKNATNHTVNLP